MSSRQNKHNNVRINEPKMNFHLKDLKDLLWITVICKEK